MGSTQQLSLKWSRYQCNWQCFLRRLKTGRLFSDVMVACDGHVFQLHRIVLASCSSYFERTLQDIPSKETPIVVLSGVSELQMRTLVEFMYCGETTVEQSHLEGLLKAAERLQVRGLVKSADDEEHSGGEDTAGASPPPGCSTADGEQRTSASTPGGDAADSTSPPPQHAELAMQSLLSAGLDALRAASPPLCLLSEQRSDVKPPLLLSEQRPTLEPPLSLSEERPALEGVRALSEEQPALERVRSLSEEQPALERARSLSTGSAEYASVEWPGADASDAESPLPWQPADIRPVVTITPEPRRAHPLPVQQSDAGPAPPPPLLPYQNSRSFFHMPPALDSSPYGNSKRNTSDSPHVLAALREISAGLITVAEASIQYDIPIPTLYVNMRRQGVKARGRVGMAGKRKPRGVMSAELRTALEHIQAGTITASKASRKYNITLPRLVSWMRKTGVRSAFAKGPQLPPPPPLPLPRLPDAAMLLALHEVRMT